MKRVFARLLIVAFIVVGAVGIYSEYLSADEATYGSIHKDADQVLPFDDISSSFAKQEIIHLYNKKILTGTSETSFSPTRPITRAEFVTVLNRLLGLEPVTSPISPFTDMKQNAWYYGSVQAAVQLELASGTSATTFAPSKAVTRQEAAVLISRALKQANGTPVADTVFKDTNRIADWASPAVASVYKLGLMKGDDTGRFRPTDSITREETAALIDRVLQNNNWAAELESEPEERIVLGWQYGQTTAQYQNSVLKSNVNTLSPRWYFLEESGTITDKTVTELITWAKANNKQIWPMVGNRFDQEATHQMLSNPTARNTVINQLTAIVSKYDLDGLNMDFENVAPKDRASFTAFITLLAEKLHAQGAVLSVDVSPDLGTDWTEAFDYAALGKQADYIVMMGYDEHYGAESGAGSNASLPYVTNAVNTLLQAVPSEKVILAMPLYNRDWTLKPNGTVSSFEYISLTQQNQMMSTYGLKPIWNKSLGQYVASYTKQSTQHKIWLEDGRSLTAKYRLTLNKKLAGTAYWHIGGESSDIWPSLRNAEKYYNYSF